ncbi:hypothetical protein QCA50_020591 [Cerrena zonata]|uniref:Uncharacterized protein n=1 Tax=Cerrena zonata TaxID=2478898 RepID=A0AAW0FGS4_9APHY
MLSSVPEFFPPTHRFFAKPFRQVSTFAPGGQTGLRPFSHSPFPFRQYLSKFSFFSSAFSQLCPQPFLVSIISHNRNPLTVRRCSVIIPIPSSKSFCNDVSS